MSKYNVYVEDVSVEAVFNKLGGVEGARRFLRDELAIVSKPTTKSTFNPVTFIGKDWSYDETRDSRSAALGLLADYSKVTLSTKWLEGQRSVNGEVRRKRILEDTSSTPLNCDHFLDLWNNKEKIPESWKKVGVVTFDGDVLRGPSGRRSVLFLYWRGGRWDWGCRWLGSAWSANDPSAVLAS